MTLRTLALDFHLTGTKYKTSQLATDLAHFLSYQHAANIEGAKALITELAARAHRGDRKACAALITAKDRIELTGTSAPPYLHYLFLSEFDDYTQAKAKERFSCYALAYAFAEEFVQKPLDDYKPDDATTHVDLEEIHAMRLVAVRVAQLAMTKGETHLDIVSESELEEVLNPSGGDAFDPQDHVLTGDTFDELWATANAKMSGNVAREIALSLIYQKRYMAQTDLDGIACPEITWLQIGRWLWEGLDHTAKQPAATKLAGRLSQLVAQRPAVTPA